MADCHVRGRGSRARKGLEVGPVEIENGARRTVRRKGKAVTEQPEHTGPDSALEEVEKEVQEAKAAVPERGEDGGEGADALTPNVDAQEQSQGEEE
jgi:hypothetical protein